MKTAEEFAGMVESCWAQQAPGILADWVSEFGFGGRLYREWQESSEAFLRNEERIWNLFPFDDPEEARSVSEVHRRLRRRMDFLLSAVRLVFVVCSGCGGESAEGNRWNCFRCRGSHIELPEETECPECYNDGFAPDGQECHLCRGYGTVVK